MIRVGTSPLTRPARTVAASIFADAQGRVWPAFALALHWCATLYYFSFSELFGNAPIARIDYALHFSDAATAVWFLKNTGRAWGYDPYFLAGYPAGTLFDVDNKGFAFFTWLLSFVLPVPVGFDVVILAAVALFPVLMFLAARNFGLSRRNSAFAVLLALALWYTDYGVKWVWANGVIAFGTVAYVSVYVVSLFLKCFGQDDARRVGVSSSLDWILLFASGILVFMIHPYSAFILPVPLLVSYARNWRSLGWRRRLAFLSWLGAILLANWYWVEPAIRFVHLKTGTDMFLQSDLTWLWRELVADPRRWLVGQALPVRWLVLFLGLYGLWRWRKGKPAASHVLTPAVLFLVAIAYTGGYLPLGRDLQTYRNLVPAFFLAAIPAAEALPFVAAWSYRILGHGVSWQRAAMGVVYIVLLYQAVAITWSSRPQWSPFRSGVSYDRISGPPAEQREVMVWLAANTANDGRILVDDTRLGALIPHYSRREVIGGPFVVVWLTYGYANANEKELFGRPIGDLDVEQMRAYLRTYNVGWIVADVHSSALDGFATRYPDVFVLETSIWPFNIYRVNLEPSYFLVGSGKLSVGYDRIEVSEASPGAVVLKYHWLETLRTEPELRIEPYPVLDDPVGLIRVDNGEVSSFTIYNRP